MIKAIFSILVAACIFVVFSQCKPQESTPVLLAPSRAYSVDADTLIRNEIQKEVEVLNSKLQQGEHGFVALSGDPSKKDSIEYWLADGKPIRISLKLDSPEAMTWPTFFLKDGKIILVRYRNWSKALPMPWAEESMVYYKDGQAFYCDERRMDLPDNMPPANLRTMPFVRSARALSQIEENYTGYWKQILDVLSREGIKL